MPCAGDIVRDELRPIPPENDDPLAVIEKGHEGSAKPGTQRRPKPVKAGAMQMHHVWNAKMSGQARQKCFAIGAASGGQIVVQEIGLTSPRRSTKSNNSSGEDEGSPSEIPGAPGHQSGDQNTTIWIISQFVDNYIHEAV